VLRLATRLFLVGTLVTGVVATVAVAWARPFLHLPDDPRIVPLVVVSLMALAGIQYVAESLRGMHDLKLASLLSGQSGGPLGAIAFFAAFLLLSIVASPSLVMILGLNALVLVGVLLFAAVGLIRATRKLVLPAADENLQTEEDSAPSGSSLSFRDLLLVCSPAVVIQSLAFLAAYGDLWIAGLNLSTDDLALYGAARRLLFFIGLPLEMLTLTVVGMIPRLYARGEIDALQNMLTRSARVAGVPSIVAGLLLLLLPGTALATLFGSFYAGAAVPLMILSVGQLASAWVGTCGATLMMTGRQAVVLPISLLSGIALFTLGPIAARHGGMNGLAGVAAGVMITQQLAYWLLAGRLLGLWTHFTLPVSLGRLRRSDRAIGEATLGGFSQSDRQRRPASPALAVTRQGD
jgi:O-antigen/teichoic acid export membrane protein